MHPKNTTASPGLQHPPATNAAEQELRGFVWMALSVRINGVSHQTLPMLNKGLAVELLEMFAMEFPKESLRILQFGAPIEDLDGIKLVASRNKDLIISIRSAERPCHEYWARLGFWGEYSRSSSAPQNGISQNVAQTSVEAQA